MNSDSLPSNTLHDSPITQRIPFPEFKFGMFIHWGLYSTLGGYWQGQPVDGIGEWIQRHAQISVAEYAQLADKFVARHFDARRWVELAQLAGMRYLVITTKHHDGFALFHSQVSDFNVVDASPLGRDIIGELAQACHEVGMPLGFYYSQSQDWHHPGGAKHGGAWDPAQEGDFDDYLQNVAEPQVRELLTRYGPVALIWFDTPMNMTPERAQRLWVLVRELQPGCLINGRLQSGNRTADYTSMRDNEIPPHVVPGPWETPATLNNTWGYKKDDHHWKSGDELICKLVDIASKGGNYLLNIGPDGDGEVPAPSFEALHAVGQWLRVNGEAIYGSAPTPFGIEFGQFTPPEREPTYQEMISGKDRPQHIENELPWRCTVRDGRLYFHLLQWPESGFVLPEVVLPARAYLLHDTERAPLPIQQEGQTRKVLLPSSLRSNQVAVLCVETEDSADK